VHVMLFLQTNSVIAVKYLPHIFGKAKFQSQLICVSFKQTPSSLHSCHTGNISTVDKQHLASSGMNSKYLLLIIRLFIQKQLEGNTFHRQHPLLYVCPFPCQSSVRVYTRDQQTRCQEIKSGGGAICD
jgi:hypothetical protein